MPFLEEKKYSRKKQTLRLTNSPSLATLFDESNPQPSSKTFPSSGQQEKLSQRCLIFFLPKFKIRIIIMVKYKNRTWALNKT